jgi:hypothetical protein
MRLVYGFHDERVVADEDQWMVAKCSRFLDPVLNARVTVEAHAKSTAVARHFAARFNAQVRNLKGSSVQGSSEGSSNAASLPTLFFVPCFVYESEEGACTESDGCCKGAEPRFFAAERYLPGIFLKYNSNNGYVAEGSSIRHAEAIQAFLHFSFEASGGAMMIADLQGVARQDEVLLTDPQVLSPGGLLGPGALRSRGRRAGWAAPRCGPTCRRLGLRPITGALLRRLVSSSGPRPGGVTASTQGATQCFDISSGPQSAFSMQSSCSSSWEKVAEMEADASYRNSHASAGESDRQWQTVPAPQGLADFAMGSDDGSSTRQGSVASISSWVHLLEG